MIYPLLFLLPSVEALAYLLLIFVAVLILFGAAWYAAGRLLSPPILTYVQVALVVVFAIVLVFVLIGFGGGGGGMRLR